MIDSEKAKIVWEACKNQGDWQRHYEAQRAQITTVLLAIIAAIVTFIPKDRPLTHEDWPVTFVLALIGLFGIVAIIKYRERANYYTQVEAAYREALDSHFDGLFEQVQKKAQKQHEATVYPWLRESRLMQHWLWGEIFFLVAVLGIVLTADALGWI